ncbi:nuclear transport factor 2 family protein, partial [Vibrio fortis]
MENSRWLDNFLDMYRQLGTDDFGALQDVYHQQVEFKDPLHQVNGLDALTRY